MAKGVTVKKHEKMKRNLRLQTEVLVLLRTPELQKVAGGLSFVADCGGTAFICGSQVGCDTNRNC